MSNCGCSNSTPCTSQECGCKFEVDAGCVRYTGDTLSCIDAQTGDLLGDILLELNNKFCDLTSGNFIEVSQEPPGNSCVNGGLKIVVKDINTYAIISTEYLCTAAALGSVTGLNTDNTDPLNPVVRISVDGTTVTGLGTPASPLVASSGIVGSGTNNYVARWTPDGNTLGTGLIRDDGSQLSIKTTPLSTALVTIDDSVYPQIAKITQRSNAAINVGLTVEAVGVGSANTAISCAATGSTVNVGVTGSASNPANVNYGAQFFSGNATTLNVGVHSYVYGGTGPKYAVKLEDGTEGVGKVLTCVGPDGEANWVTPATGIAGSGINNYVARWTPDGNTLGYGLIIDNGTTTGVGSNVGYLGALFSVDTQGNNHGSAIVARSNHTSTAQKNAIYAISEGSGTGDNVGYYANVLGSATANYGAKIYVNQGTDQLNIGIYTNASILSPGTGIAYCAQFVDGTEGIGKVLTSVTSDGKANWADVNPQKFITYPADFIGTNYTLTSADNGYSIVVINGSTAVTITVPTGLIAKMQVGFIQDGIGNVTFTPASTTLNNAISGYKIKGQYEQVYLEQGLTSAIYYLLGNTKV